MQSLKGDKKQFEGDSLCNRKPVEFKQDRGNVIPDRTISHLLPCLTTSHHFHHLPLSPTIFYNPSSSLNMLYQIPPSPSPTMSYRLQSFLTTPIIFHHLLSSPPSPIISDHLPSSHKRSHHLPSFSTVHISLSRPPPIISHVTKNERIMKPNNFDTLGQE